MEEKYTIELTAKEKSVVEQALYFAKCEYKNNAMKNRSKESGSGIHTVVADRMERHAHEFYKVLLKFLDAK